MKGLLGLLVVALSHYTYADIRVAFYEVLDRAGRIERVESDTTISHVAISYKDVWLHAYPERGVELISDREIKKLAREFAIITVKGVRDLKENDIKQYLGKPYDDGFDWHDTDRYYCSKLVAKILNISPCPMVFDTRYWPPHLQKLDGRPGMSPGKLYRFLSQNADFSS